jgi:putative Holliday junction resolvase
MKYFCIDYGRRRIGIAVSDSTAILAKSRPMIDRKTVGDYLLKITEVINEEDPDELIIGLPLDIDDNETEMSREIRSFTQKLQEKLNKKIPISFQDESFSSVKANIILRKTVTRKKRAKKERVDSVAACIILQEFLDNRSNAALE